VSVGDSFEVETCHFGSKNTRKTRRGGGEKAGLISEILPLRKNSLISNGGKPWPRKFKGKKEFGKKKRWLRNSKIEDWLKASGFRARRQG